MQTPASCDAFWQSDVTTGWLAVELATPSFSVPYSTNAPKSSPQTEIDLLGVSHLDSGPFLISRPESL